MSTDPREKDRCRRNRAGGVIVVRVLRRLPKSAVLWRPKPGNTVLGQSGTCTVVPHKQNHMPTAWHAPRCVDHPVSTRRPRSIGSTPTRGWLSGSAFVCPRDAGPVRIDCQVGTCACITKVSQSRITQFQRHDHPVGIVRFEVDINGDGSCFRRGRGIERALPIMMESPLGVGHAIKDICGACGKNDPVKRQIACHHHGRATPLPSPQRRLPSLR